MKEPKKERKRFRNLREVISIGGKARYERVLCFFSFILHPSSFFLLFFWITSLALLAFAQSGRTSPSGKRTTVLNVIAHKVEDPNKPKPLLSDSSGVTEEIDKIIPKHVLELYDGGILQKIESFAPDPTPARIVILLDNSSTLQTDVKKLAAVPATVAPEIY